MKVEDQIKWGDISGRVLGIALVIAVAIYTIYKIAGFVIAKV